MVGVQNSHIMTAKQIRWLQHGGKKILYKLLDEMENRLRMQGMLYDFWGTIWLPTDIIVEAFFKKGGGRAFWTFDEKERKEAEEFCEQLKRTNLDAKISITTAKRYMDFKGNMIMTDFNWHGDKGALLIFTLLDQIFQALKRSPFGDIVRLELIRFEQTPSRLPLFVPKGSERLMRRFAKNWSISGDLIVLPDRRVLKRTDKRLRRATARDIAEFSINVL